VITVLIRVIIFSYSINGTESHLTKHWSISKLQIGNLFRRKCRYGRICTWSLQSTAQCTSPTGSRFIESCDVVQKIASGT